MPKPVYVEEEIIPNERRRNRRKNVRKEKEEATPVKEKFLAVQGDVPLPCAGMEFYPRGENQKKLNAMIEEGRSILFAVGTAGTGKSIVSINQAAKKLKAKKIHKIYLARPAVSVGKSVGLLPGELRDKLAPYFAQTVNHFEKFLGKGFTKYCLDKEVIEMCAVEYLRGTSFEDCFVLVEESQNLTEEEFEMMLTRIGDGCTMVFTGDQKQTDLRGNNGLVRTLNFLKAAKAERSGYLDTDDMNHLISNVGIVEFTFKDVQRSGIVKALTKLYFYKDAA
jgi:phosphate starvation-inducible PhoH-like protein